MSTNTDTIREEVEHALEWAQDTGHAFLRVGEHEFDAYLAEAEDALTPPAQAEITILSSGRWSRCAKTNVRRYTIRAQYTIPSEILELDRELHELELTLEIDPFA